VKLKARLACLVFGAASLAPAAVALAKDICVKDSDGGSFVFRKVDTLRPGRVVRLTGVRVNPFVGPSRQVAPVDGTAVMRPDGTVTIGLLVHSMGPLLSDPGSSFVVAVQTDAAFSGVGTSDFNGDFRADVAVTWTSTDCGAIAIP
jgi:hypothetical protein